MYYRRILRNKLYSAFIVVPEYLTLKALRYGWQFYLQITPYTCYTFISILINSW